LFVTGVAKASDDGRAAERREIRWRAVMAWTVLVGAGLLEIVWAIALKYADGFTRFWPSAIGLAAAVVSFVLLSMALKSLPVGTAYAVWVGIGALGVAITGIIALGESASLLRLGLLALILIGIVGLKLVEG
jgi:quaternary ammonium compound-resistance protein SugE